MNTTSLELNNIVLDFKTLTRQKTGIHAMDSGGASGRKWQQPQSPSHCYFEAYSDMKVDGLRAYIPLYSWLDEVFQIDEDLTRELYGPEYEDLKVIAVCHEDTIAVVEAMTGLKHIAMDNTYNHDTDFDQDFQFSVFSDSDDWYYSKNTVILLETHNGADIRGGYSQCVLVRFNTGTAEDSGFLDWKIDLEPANGEQSIYEELEEYQGSYGSNVGEYFDKHIKRLVSISDDKRSITLEHNDGRILEFEASTRAFRR